MEYPREEVCLKQLRLKSSARDTTAITDREILTHALSSAAQTQAEKTLPERYRAHAEELWGRRVLGNGSTRNKPSLHLVKRGFVYFFKLIFHSGKL